MNEDRIEGSVKDFAGKTETAFGKVTGDAEAQAAGRARETAGKAQNLFGKAEDAARDTAEAVAEYAKDVYNNRGDVLRDGSQALKERVQDNPLGALVTAGAVGFALGLWMTRPPRRRQPRWRYYD